MNQQVRVRFAPSPTGIPHVGNIRTALFNWLYARHMGGKFIVRIEDTDVARTIDGAVEAIYDSLHWLGIDWDEGPDVGGEFGPYMQSKRLPIYRNAAEYLINQGYAYYCYCSSERLEKMRAEQVKRKEPPRYDRRCRELNEAEQRELAAKGIIPVVRFKIPLYGKTVFNDQIRGEVAFENSVLDDLVLLKSDGYPTYHLANVVDDHMMQISHVLRADEWLASTPKHVLLYSAFKYDPPQFAHLPMILGEDRAKLSKRHGATSLMEYRDKGYLPEAMMNFLALLGWSLDDKTEIMNREELIRNFSIERIGKTGAIFSLEKLSWMNGVYLRRFSIDELTGRALPLLENGLSKMVKRPIDKDYLKQIIPLIQERVKTLTELPDLTEFFFTDDLQYDTQLLVGKGLTIEISLNALKVATKRLESLLEFDSSSLEHTLRLLADELQLKTGQLFGILRITTTGRSAAPPLFQTMEVLGKTRCISRIKRAIENLQKLA